MNPKISTQFTRVINSGIVLLLLPLFSACNKNETTIMTPPKAKIIETKLEIHGDVRIDPYFWLNDRENPDVIKYLEEENRYTEAIMKDTEELQETIYNEIIGRIKQDDQSVPYEDNGYYYYSRYEEGNEYPVFCRKKGSVEATEEVMLNVNEMAAGNDYYHVTGLSVSKDNKFLAFGIDNVGRRQYSLHVKNLLTGDILDLSIENTTGSAAWVNDNRTFYYTSKDPQTLRTNRILRHHLGSNPENDVVVYTEEDETFYCGVYKSKSDKYIIIGSGSTLSNEYHFADANDPKALFSIFHKREPELEYSIAHYKENFYIITNHNARNFRLMKTPVDKTEKKFWTEVIPHREDVYLDDIDIFNKYLVVSERKDGLMHLRIIEWESGTEHYIDFEEEAYVASTSANPAFDTKILRYNYTSLTTPNSVYDYDMESRKKELLKQQEVVGDFSPKNYEAKRLYAKASDGKMIPVSMVYKKGIELNGDNPLLLYGYGSYGITIDPYFNSSRLSLLERGFIFAIAHIRGGQIYGRDWYDEGKLLKKKNTFTDFISAAEYLIDTGYTSNEKIFALGGSAGGLLVGAVINMRPDLFKGVIAAVPFVDVVTTMLDESIPLTTGEYDEWGNPNEKEYYHYMLSYSPYDNVKAVAYPAMLVMTGLHDSQVQYWEPAKWVAKLRTHKTDDNILLLHTNMDAGHGGSSGRFKAHKETALEYAFLLKLMQDK